MLMDEKVDDTRASEKLSAESSSLREKGSEESKERRGGLKRHVSPDVPAVARQRIGDLGGEDSVSQRKKTRTDSAAISHPSDPDEEKECTEVPAAASGSTTLSGSIRDRLLGGLANAAGNQMIRGIAQVGGQLSAPRNFGGGQWGTSPAMDMPSVGLDQPASAIGQAMSQELAAEYAQLRSRLASQQVLGSLMPFTGSGYGSVFPPVTGFPYNVPPDVLQALVRSRQQNNLLSLASTLNPLAALTGGYQSAPLAANLFGQGSFHLTGLSGISTNDLLVALSRNPRLGQLQVGASSTASTSLSLPTVLARPEDNLKLSAHQVLLRQQIEVFQATEDDLSTHTRGRNKPITMGQVGIRCRHCARLPVGQRQKGSTYFPASLLGLYQAAQNMSTTHMQCGLCSEMPASIKQQFVQLLASKGASSGAGRPYWAKSAAKLGLVDTEEGIRFFRDIPPGVRLVGPSENNN